MSWEELYNTKTPLKQSNLTGDFLSVILTTSFFLAIIVSLYTRLFLGIDFEKWDIQKCNPKYIFYSGYIKQNPNSSSIQSTSDNFKECIIKYNNQKNVNFSDFLQQNASEHLQKSREMANTHDRLTSQKVLELQKKVNTKNQEFQLQLENIKQARGTSELQDKINKLNDIIQDVKDYAHSYLTYAMMHFVFKLKIAEEDGTINNQLNTDTPCSGYDEQTCNSNVYCDYDDSSVCQRITIGNFYSKQATKMNEFIKQHFENNKL